VAQASPEERLRKLLQPAIEQLGLELREVSWRSGKGRAVLRLTVDRPGGITIDECGEASEAASALLDGRDELLPGPYSLEVSSPGAEHPLRSEQELAAALGRRVELTLRDGDARVVLEGRLVSVGPEDLELEARRGRSGRLRSFRVPRGTVAAARVVVDL
jgi:ribosome maturation factor RimP